MESVLRNRVNGELVTSREAAKGFLARLAGPATEELDFLLCDSEQIYRLKNQLRMLGRTQEILASSKSEPNAVPFRTLLTILEGAALEDDGTLIAKWAALLANSTKDRNSFAAHPSLPKILAELVPLEVRFIDHLAENGIIRWQDFRKELSERLQASEDRIDLYCGNLSRMGLVTLTEKSIALAGSVDSYIEISPFGQSFLSACSSM